MYPYPKLRTGCRYQWSADGGTLLLQDCNNRRSFRLSRPVGQLLCGLNGWTRPGCNTPLSAGCVYRYLCAFARHGLLQEPDFLLTAPGTLLLSFPCRKLRQGRHSLLLGTFHRLIQWLWVPLLAAVLLVTSLQDMPLLRGSLSYPAILLFLLLLAVLNTVVHEWAHAAAANACGIPVSAFGAGINSGFPCAFTLIPLMPYAPPHVRRAVSRAGPLSNLCLGCILLLLFWEIPYFRHELVFLDGVINIFQCLINLLPLEGLDGHAILCTFPALARVLEPEEAPRRGGWSPLLERYTGVLLRPLVRIGLPVYLCYEALSLLTIILEIFLS